MICNQKQCFIVDLLPYFLNSKSVTRDNLAALAVDCDEVL